jgi:sigma-B regulation protein RsbU (phosphoserine phosphatase)
MDPAQLEQIAARRETERLNAIERSGVFNSALDQPLRHLVRATSYLFEAPTAILAIVGRETIELRSKVGIELARSPREPGFAGSAIMTDEAWVIPDTLADPIASQHSLVVIPNGIRFYAGKAVLFEGLPIGVLSVLDYAPREIEKARIAGLTDLSHVAEALIEFHSHDTANVRRPDH